MSVNKDACHTVVCNTGTGINNCRCRYVRTRPPTYQTYQQGKQADAAPRMQEIFGTPCRVVPIARQRAGIARKQKGAQSIPHPALCETENPMPGGL